MFVLLEIVEVQVNRLRKYHHPPPSHRPVCEITVKLTAGWGIQILELYAVSFLDHN
jgi:hypothetical protein